MTVGRSKYSHYESCYPLDCTQLFVWVEGTFLLTASTSLMCLLRPLEAKNVKKRLRTAQNGQNMTVEEFDMTVGGSSDPLDCTNRCI